MRLKMDAKGDIVQVDSRFDDDRGTGRTAPLVEEDNVASLSVGKDRQYIFDRIRATEMSKVGQRNYRKQQLINSFKTRIRKSLEDIAKHYAGVARKYSDKQFENKNNAVKIVALNQRAQNFEKFGVSGDISAGSGAKPFPTFPAIDYPIYESATNDFGAPGGAGADPTDMWQYTEPVRTTTYVPPKTQAEIYKSMKVMETPIKGGFTTFHKFLIGLWENNSFVVRQYRGARKIGEDGKYLRDEKGQYIYSYNKNVTPMDTIITLASKKVFWDRAENIKYGTRAEGQKEMLASSMRGWMWSGYHDTEGNWVQVKVPFIYGLPMDFPENIKTESEEQDLKYYRINEYLINPTYSAKLYDSLADIIQAYAMYYKYMLGDVDFSPEAEIKIDESLTAAAESGDLKPIVKSIVKEKAIAAGAFEHPMLSEGLLPKRG